MAVNYLKGGNADEARQLISRLVQRHRYSSADGAYYWALSVLSGRSLSALDVGDLNEFDEAFAMAERHRSGDWWRASEFLYRFLNAQLDFETSGRSDAEVTSDLLQRYSELPDQLREEIQLNLDLILAGGMQDQIEDMNADRVRAARMAGDRHVRVWKFFEPDPTPPVKKIPRPATPMGPEWTKAAIGGGFGVVGILVLVNALLAENPIAAVLVLVLLVCGVYTAGRFGFERAYLRTRLAAKESEFAAGQRAEYTRPGGDAVTAGFADRVAAEVQDAFSRHQPQDPQWRDRWWRDTGGLRTALRGDLVDLYGYTGVAPSTISWLADHHAGDIADRWRQGTLTDFRLRLRVPPAVHGAFALGVTSLAVGALVAVAALGADHLAAVLGAAILIFFGQRYGKRGARPLYCERRRLLDDEVEFTQRWQAECVAHERRVRWLADRPSDMEMARWLDLDLVHWKRSVMKDYRLSHHEVFAHLVLNEPAPGSVRARIVGGPFRHSSYTVLLFLLTETGVRQVSATLDFPTGIFAGERRTTFRYDAIASVKVDEVSVRYDNGRRRVVSTAEGDNAWAVPSDKVVSHQAFLLTLVNSQNVRVLVDNFAESVDLRRENIADLERLALDRSGVTSALRVLEAVAADGREWISMERQRLRRRLPRRSLTLGSAVAGELPSPRVPAAGEHGSVQDHGPNGPAPASGWVPG
ncbi:hypothetical protein O7635_19195 [Asanoa sp. WMMD1127]|uniref:hypothetical protein n=1 Tax=Asanoa sp. WMMD1127 TaxID=3016107 RepID=UPI00241785E9|nr:hypothetical protein [Asanoa sp. WMMD1127]MDG4823986.1 hypothetical protein [Asanoa sp. WMMD1127]